MSAYIDKRSHSILQSIVNNYPTITGKDIENMYDITRKQLSYSVKKINDYLTTLGFDEIKRENTGLFIVSKDVLEKFKSDEYSQSSTYILSEKERMYVILLILFSRTEEISVNHFTYDLNISKNTLLSDLKKIKLYLEKYNMYILYTRKDGYFISGSEYSKRTIMIETIKNILKMPKGKNILFDTLKINEEDIQNIHTNLELLESDLKIKFTDERIRELQYIIYANLIRIRLGKILNELPEAFKHILGTKEHLIITSFLSLYDVNDEREALFLTSQIQISKIHYLEFDDLYDKKDLIKISKEVIKNFERLSGVIFKDTDDLLQLLVQHFVPAFYRIKYNYHLENSILDLILPEYIDLHHIVKKAVEPYEKFIKEKINDEELVYITVLFGASLSKEGILKNVIYNKKAVIVCINGVTVSNYMLITLKKLFPQIEFLSCLSMRDFYNYNEDYDIVFSTVNIKTDKVLFLVKPFPDENSKEMFKKHVLEELNYKKFNDNKFDELVNIIENHSDNLSKEELVERLKNIYTENDTILEDKKIEDKLTLKDLLVKDNIKISNVAIDWKQAIEITAFPLLYANKIYARYVKRMIQIIEEEKPFIMISDGVAVAHAGVDDGVIAPGIAITLFPEKISFNEYMDIDILIVLATPDTKVHLNALWELIEILEDDNIMKKIRCANNENEVLKLMNLM